jgi:TonB family protein
MTPSPVAGTVLGVVASVLLHGAAFHWMERVPPISIEHDPANVALELVETLPPLPPPEPPPPEKPADVPEVKALPTAMPVYASPARPPAARPAATAPPPAVAAPLTADLTGVTLSNDGDGDTFASPVGNGEAWQGPIAAGAGRSAAGAMEGKEKGGFAASPSFTPVKDLSVRPFPPDLDGSLRSNYPSEARSRAIGGTARVRARIESDGRVKGIAVLDETFAGFGEACKRTLSGSRWSPPQDRAGQPVATEIVYTCHFEVSR